ncbi:hypothetical protein [Flammeovirga aprica]|uniref:DUF4476 domain-containing protein n=1 Tax=Flammeovirga aprica JL-4 TaxID=694437 RepID=A0A7X9RXD4_9BACT|nr:hypothetical protein [Flammeovirga aprica]NME70501.1 hypothetical protein [Flammeovirga aprica JL-4]
MKYLFLLFIALFLNTSLYAQEEPLSKTEAEEKFRQIMMSSDVNVGGLSELRYYIETGNVNFDDYLYIAQLLQEYPAYTVTLLETARQISFSRRETTLYKSLIELPFLDLASKYKSEIHKFVLLALRSKNEEEDAKLQAQIDDLISKCHYKTMEAFKEGQTN